MVFQSQLLNIGFTDERTIKSNCVFCLFFFLSVVILQKFPMFLACVAANGENVILVATEYAVGDPLSADGWIAGLHFGDPGAWKKKT